MSTAPGETKRTCGYGHGGWKCLIEAEPNHDECIFHLPMERKKGKEASFWDNLAHYLWALRVHWDRGHFDKLDSRLPSQHWLKGRPVVGRNYENITESMMPWRFTGFVFPAMDKNHHLQMLDFPAVSFADAKFHGSADFQYAHFMGEASFEDSQFLGDASFRDATFDDKALFFKARIHGDLDFSYAHVKYRLHFGGADIRPKANVRLWGLNFGQGSKGPAVGEVIFRDLPDRNEGGMGRVSFLHTVVYEDRPCFRFENVHWQEDPRAFLRDAELALGEKQDWPRLGVVPEREKEMYQLFNVITESDSGETQAQPQALAVDSLYKFVRLDVERTAREIRRYYEDYGSYLDAGDFHIAEMEYRRVQTRTLSFHRLLLAAYKELSMYGENPGRAASYLLAVVLAAAAGYSLVGVAPLTACLYGIGGLVPGLVRAAMVENPTVWLVAVMASQSVFGSVVLSLLLLAIRRRFRR
jgi:hypothetical protein